MRTMLALGALSRTELHMASLALGVSFMVTGASLLIRGERSGLGPYSAQQSRSGGAIAVVLGAVLASQIIHWGACQQCGTTNPFDYFWLAVIGMITVFNLWRIWGRPFRRRGFSTLTAEEVGAVAPRMTDGVTAHEAPQRSITGWITYPAQWGNASFSWPLARVIVRANDLILTPRGPLVRLQPPVAIPYREITRVAIFSRGLADGFRFRSDRREFDNLTFATVSNRGFEQLAKVLTDHGIKFV